MMHVIRLIEHAQEIARTLPAGFGRSAALLLTAAREAEAIGPEHPPRLVWDAYDRAAAATGVPAEVIAAVVQLALDAGHEPTEAVRHAVDAAAPQIAAEIDAGRGIAPALVEYCRATYGDAEGLDRAREAYAAAIIYLLRRVPGEVMQMLRGWQ